MIYPSGSKVKVGDLVWWDERSAIGHVVLLCETVGEIAEYGMGEAGIWICYDGSASEDGLIVAYPERAFVDEGVDKINSQDSQQICMVISAAKVIVNRPPENSSFGVFWGRRGEDGFGWKVVCFHEKKFYASVFVNPETLHGRLLARDEIGIDVWI